MEILEIFRLKSSNRNSLYNIKLYLAYSKDKSKNALKYYSIHRATKRRAGMNRIFKTIILSCIMFVSLSSAFTQTNSNSKSASIHIVAIVPSVLRLSLDFAQNSTTQVAGYIGGIEENQRAGTLANTTTSRFEIRDGAQVELGDARLFSNVPGSYSIDVYSMNRKSVV